MSKCCAFVSWGSSCWHFLLRWQPSSLCPAESICYLVYHKIRRRKIPDEYRIPHAFTFQHNHLETSRLVWDHSQGQPPLPDLPETFWHLNPQLFSPHPVSQGFLFCVPGLSTSPRRERTGSTVDGLPTYLATSITLQSLPLANFSTPCMSPHFWAHSLP